MASFECSDDLLMRLKVYLHDLMHFNKHSEDRLVTHHPLFLSDFYFSDEDRDLLLAHSTEKGTVLEVYEQLHQRKVAEAAPGTTSAVLCTSHDIAPLVMRAYGIRKGFEESKEFKRFRKRFQGRSSS